jgi:MscS family membrane protein
MGGKRKHLVVATLCVLFAGVASAGHSLEPVETSSPRATVMSFLALTEEAARRYTEYRDSPSPETQDTLWQLTYRTERLFDLSQVAPAARHKVVDKTFYLLWEVIARVELPDLAEIPGGSTGDADGEGAALPSRWRVPGTGITIARVEEGPRSGEFLFSSDTVEQTPRFYEAARDLPYRRPMPIENVYRINQLLTGWLIPMRWVEKVPDWADTPVFGQVLWKWFALALLFGLAFAAVVVVLRWVKRRPWDGSLRSYLRYLIAPATISGSAIVVRFLAAHQINVTGAATEMPEYLLEIANGIAGIWFIWLTARRIAEIVSPRTGAAGRDVSLMRLVIQAVGLVAVVVVAFRVANNLGIPVYGLVAGAGIGGLGIALAARSTLENFLGTLNLYADRPVRAGEFCRYGEDPASDWLRIGTVEEIGLRSTRIRGIDRTVTTIPNAEFSNMHIVNLTKRERMLFRTTLALRYETTPDQLRLVLARLREMLIAHPRVTMAPSRVRAIGFGAYSLNVEIFAYVDTADWNEFLAVKEDLVLRIMDIVKDAGTAFAFPSRTLYHGRDSGPDRDRQDAAEEQVREWTAAHHLPFPDFSAEYRKEIRDTIEYPPEGSAVAGKD